jgi:2-oxoisovalerate dehydrogenase E1 component
MMQFKREGYSNEKLLSIYRELIIPRMIEEKMLTLLRQGKISKWFSGIGQEATSVGTALAMENDEYLLPMHRNLGVFTVRGIPFQKLFAQFQGKESGFTKGRDRSFHFGTKEHKIVGMISHLGPQMGVADGIALGNKLRKEQKAVLVFTGDGGTSQGDFHESVNVAAVWNLPVIFVIENNGYGLSTPSSEQFKCRQFTDKAIGYGIDAVQVDGNNVLDVLTATSKIVADIRLNPRPFILECLTFRMRGHEEASGTKYIPAELFELWGKKDPISNFENYLIEEKVIDTDFIIALKSEIKGLIDQGIQDAFSESEPEYDIQKELDDVYAPAPVLIPKPDNQEFKEMRFVDAISDGLRKAMREHPNLILMGQDIGVYGGVFKVTEGFLDEFGTDRVRNTPLCESAIVGTAFGLSINGFKAMVEMQFADFVTCGFNQIVNNLAKSHWRWGQNADVVIRMPTGAGVAAGPFHSQSTESWFCHVPGLKVVYPAFPDDARSLLLESFNDPNPVMFFEHKALYRSVSGPVSLNDESLSIGKANLLRSGNDLTIVTYGMGVHWAVKALDELEELSADLIDLRTLIPWDKEKVVHSVQKTGKVIILSEDTLTGGFTAEIGAYIAEHCFRFLDAPVMRCGSVDTPVPFEPNLEEGFLPAKRFVGMLKKLSEY